MGDENWSVVTKVRHSFLYMHARVSHIVTLKYNLVEGRNQFVFKTDIAVMNHLLRTFLIMRFCLQISMNLHEQFIQKVHLFKGCSSGFIKHVVSLINLPVSHIGII